MDFFVLPGGTVDLPGRGPIGGTPTVTPQNSAPEGGVVQFTSAEWQQRAKVARECADELQVAVDNIAGVLGDNYFGKVKEGNRLHSQLVGVVEVWKDNLTEQISALTALAAGCDCADAELHCADQTSATDLRA
ncbi:hypothetical protein [Gordonia sp. NPDC003429]